MNARLQQLVTTRSWPPREVQEVVEHIYQHVLKTSPYLKKGNFTSFHPDDLRRLFVSYDEHFFEGECRKTLGKIPLSFRISPRMTSAGGKTTWMRSREGQVRFEITVSSTLLLRTFDDSDHRPITVSGILCHDRLQALQRVMEHEIVHLIEMLLWNDSNCRASRFQSIASRHFQHREHTHRLITPREQALVRFGIRPGTRVRFRFEGTQYVGIVNRITKRATVLVPSARGVQYSDGQRYETYYVPLPMLEPIGESS